MYEINLSTKRLFAAAIVFAVLLGCARAAAAWPLSFVDSSGRQIVLEEKPRRVVSLSPSLTEILFGLGAGESVAGLTCYDGSPRETAEKEIVGGFLAPSLARVEALHPDMIFATPLQGEVRDRFAGQPCKIVELESHSFSDLYRNIRILGAVFDKRAEAEEMVESIEGDLRLISRKAGKIPASERKRVLRLMGDDAVMTPGDDSFQNDFIRAAGGIPPQTGRMGGAVEMTLDEWKRFDPQVIYRCGGNRQAVDDLLSRPGWKDVDAVREGKVFDFPCELACRASVNSGRFVAWLASTIYSEEFARERNRVLEEKLIRTSPVEIPLDYVRSAQVEETAIFDFPNKTLIIEFRRPMRVTSTLEGERKGILTVGNHYFPPPCWNLGHSLGLDRWRNHALKAIRKTKTNSSFLFTGADMGNLSTQKARFRDMEAWALVTAGVAGNALRTSADAGLFYEPGTINVLLLTNMKLSARARTRAIVTATEAKTAALQDLDIRSSYSPRTLQATGTGTDETIVVEGTGRPIDNTGGHCKMGELIARAVYDGVREAIYRQNGVAGPRNVFRRLQERGIDLYEICGKYADFSDARDRLKCLGRMEELLMQPPYASFLEASMALSDAFERGQLSIPETLRPWCAGVSRSIAGGDLEPSGTESLAGDMPVAMKMAFDAMLDGLAAKEKIEREAEGGKRR